VFVAVADPTNAEAGIEQQAELENTRNE